MKLMHEHKLLQESLFKFSRGFLEQVFVRISYIIDTSDESAKNVKCKGGVARGRLVLIFDCDLFLLLLF